jgi:Breast carcinoma amplified sequence 2 (BCAS2).
LEEDEGGSTPQMVAKQDSNKIRTAKIILLHEQIRQIHLELYAISASSMWKHHVSMMDKYALYSKEMLEQQLLKVDEINAERKRMQEEAVKSQLGRLEYRWGELMSKKQHLMRGVKILEEEMMKE